MIPEIDDMLMTRPYRCAIIPGAKACAHANACDVTVNCAAQCSPKRQAPVHVRDAGIVDKNINPAEDVVRVRRESRDIGTRADVAGNARETAAASRNLFRETVEFGRAAREAGHVGTVVGERDCDLAPEAPPRTGNDRAFAGEREVVHAISTIALITPSARESESLRASSAASSVKRCVTSDCVSTRPCSTSAIAAGYTLA